MPTHRTSTVDSDAIIAELVDAACGAHGGARSRHALREALRGLVRLAKVEQLMAMRLDAERAAGGMTPTSQRRHTKALLRKIGMDVQAGRYRLQADWGAAGLADDAPRAGFENDCGER